MDSHYKDKKVSLSSYLCIENPFTWKDMASSPDYIMETINSFNSYKY